MRVHSSVAVRSKAGKVCASLPGSRAGSGRLQWTSSGPPGNSGQTSADAIAQADHVVEALPGEPAQALGTSPGDVDATRAHHTDRVGMQRLRVAPGAHGLDRATGEVLAERLGHLRARAVARAQEEHAGDRGADLGLRAVASACREPRVQRHAGAGEQLAAACEVEDVVGVAAVGSTATRRHEATVAEPPQVIRDQALAPVRLRAELAHAAIAACQLGQQPPSQRVSGQLQETRRCALAIACRSRHRHGEYIKSI